MPLKIELKVGSDTFLLEGELGGPIDEQVVNLAIAWTAALPPQNPDSEDARVAAQIREVKGQIATQRETLSAGVTPAPEPDAEPAPVTF